MPAPIDDALFESIVAGVLDRLRTPSAPNQASDGRQPEGPSPSKVAPSSAAPPTSEPIHLTDRVITASLLAEKLNGTKSVRFSPKAVLTPTARDYLKANLVQWAYATKAATDKKSPGTGRFAALVVRSTPAVERVLADLLPDARTELLACPDDAAKLAVAEISRGGFAGALLLTEQTHRAACLSNRHESVKAVAVRDASDVAAVRRQLRANVWCLDPTGRTYFELRNLLKAINKE